jgi:HK97 gp10 family phage protein
VVDVQIKGMDELLKSLKILPERIQKNVLVGAIRAGATSISKEMKRFVPKDTGELQKSIGVVKRKSKNKNEILFTVAPQIKKGGWKAHFHEFGTIKMPAHPFVRPAFEGKGNEAIEVAKEYMTKRIDKELAKL